MSQEIVWATGRGKDGARSGFRVEVVMVNGHVDANRLGIVGAVLLTAWHGVWVTLSATGAAQRVADFVLRMHGMKSEVAMGPFEPGMAVLLLMSTAALGYIVGAAGAGLWNCLGAVRLRGKAGVSARV